MQFTAINQAENWLYTGSIQRILFYKIDHRCGVKKQPAHSCQVLDNSHQWPLANPTLLVRLAPSARNPSLGIFSCQGI